MNVDAGSAEQIVRRRIRAGDEPSAPRRPDGSAWRYELVFDRGLRRSYADDLALLVGELIPGYVDLSPDEQQATRVAHAHDIQPGLQAGLIVDIGLGGCSAAAREFLMEAWSARPAIEAWEEPVPLVLVDADYLPLTSTERPVERGGLIVWLDTVDDEAYLTSLTVAGEVVLARSMA
jgi:hypothetical protein